MKSTNLHYGAVAVVIHWLSALLIFALIITVFRAGWELETSAKATLLRMHLPMAFALLAVTIFRIVWWSLADDRPHPVVGSPLWQERAANVVRVIFYVVIFGLIGSGMGMMALSGAPEIIFGEEIAYLPNFWSYPPRFPHAVGTWLIVSLLALHSSAALHHHFIRRDATLRRIWFA